MKKRWILGFCGCLWACGGQQNVAPVDPLLNTEDLAPIPVMEEKKVAVEGGPLDAQAVALMSQGLEAIRTGEREAAAQFFREALSLEPRLVEAHYDLGILEEQAGRWPEARAAYEAALKERPDFGPAVVANASLIFRQEGFSAARRFAEECLSKNEEDLDLRNARNAVLLFESGHAADVVTDSKLVLRKDERNVSARLNLSTAFYEQGKFEMSMQVAEDVLLIEPENIDALSRKGLAAEKLELMAVAQQSFEQILALSSSVQPEILNELGLIYHRAGDFSGAEAMFREALSLWPGMFEAQVNLANALKSQGLYKESLEAFLQAKTLSAHSSSAAEVDYNLAAFYLDAQLPDVDEVTRLQLAIENFERYQSALTTSSEEIEKYLKEARKRLEVAQKRAEQMRNQPKPAKTPESDGENPASSLPAGELENADALNSEENASLTSDKDDAVLQPPEQPIDTTAPETFEPIDTAAPETFEPIDTAAPETFEPIDTAAPAEMPQLEQPQAETAPAEESIETFDPIDTFDPFDSFDPLDEFESESK